VGRRDDRGGGRLVSERIFTPAEVDALLPRLSALVETMIDRHRVASALARELRADQERIQVAGGSRIDQAEWKARAERLDGLGIEVRAALEAIGELGGAVKDLEMGLVDFPGRVPDVMGETTVNLCWKHGETAVRFWHGFDEGYASRKPLP
jgi:hypothetical protein